MTFIQKKVYYFEKPGEVNTQDAARFAVERAKELNIRRIVVASHFRKDSRSFF